MGTRIGSAALTCLLWLASTADSRAEPATPQASPPAADDDLSSVVLACVDKKGKLLSAEIARSSGYQEIDDASLKVAQASIYAPATKNGKPRRKSCVRFKVQFVLRDGKAVLAEPPANP